MGNRGPGKKMAERIEMKYSTKYLDGVTGKKGRRGEPKFHERLGSQWQFSR